MATLVQWDASNLAAMMDAATGKLMVELPIPACCTPLPTPRYAKLTMIDYGSPPYAGIYATAINQRQYYPYTIYASAKIRDMPSGYTLTHWLVGTWHLLVCPSVPSVGGCYWSAILTQGAPFGYLDKWLGPATGPPLVTRELRAIYLLHGQTGQWGPPPYNTSEWSQTFVYLMTAAGDIVQVHYVEDPESQYNEEDPDRPWPYTGCVGMTEHTLYRSWQYQNAYGRILNPMCDGDPYSPPFYACTGIEPWNISIPTDRTWKVEEVF